MEQKRERQNLLGSTEIVREASVPDRDQIERQMRRGRESSTEGDKKDVAAAVDFEDTPHGREETKKKSREGR